VIFDFGKAEYFFREGWTRMPGGSLTGKSVKLARGLGLLSKNRELNYAA
jgi:hypothetical protein